MSEMPPSPSSLPLLGHTIEYARDPFEFVERAVDSHGDVVELDVLGTDGPYVLSHPDHVERVLVDEHETFAKTDDFTEAFGAGLVAVEGELWSEQRQFLQPLFYREVVRGYADTMVDQIERRVDRWKPGETRSIREEMGALTLEVVFATLFGRELSVGGDARLRQAASGLNDLVVPTSWVLPDWVPTPSRRRFARSRETLREEVRRLLEERETDGERGGRDLLSMLASARDGDGYPANETAVEDQLVSMLFAGHETTALALTYTWYLLSRHPEIEARVHEEVDRVVGDERPRAAHVDDLELTNSVLQEAMRLYPPVHTIPRRATRSVDVGGYRIPDEAEVHVSVYVLHRDERFFDDPLAFRPERWLVEDQERPRFAYLPFGAGPRRCIGRQFALTEAVLAVAAVARAYRLEWVGDGDLELAPEMTTQPVGDVPMRIHARSAD